MRCHDFDVHRIITACCSTMVIVAIHEISMSVLTICILPPVCATHKTSLAHDIGYVTQPEGRPNYAARGLSRLTANRNAFTSTIDLRYRISTDDCNDMTI